MQKQQFNWRHWLVHHVCKNTKQCKSSRGVDKESLTVSFNSSKVKVNYDDEKHL